MNVPFCIPGLDTRAVLVAFLLALFCGCFTPPVVTKVKIIEPRPSEQFINLSSEEVTAEMKRLQKLLLDTATTSASSTDQRPSRQEIITDLFELSVHLNNPDPDYQQAYAYAATLYRISKTRKLYYLNWERVLKTQVRLRAERDSLENAFQKDSKKSRSLAYVVRLREKQIDSLKVVIEEQKEKLEKLKKLDLTMEKQRSTIQ